MNLGQFETPSFIYEAKKIIQALQLLNFVNAESDCKILFSLKPFAVIDALHLMAPLVDGFAASSLFETKIARKVLDGQGTVHITTPGFRPGEMRTIAKTCDYISFNSISQLHRFRGEVADQAKCGLRINPQLSFVKDERYNPCRKHSKLGVPLDELAKSMNDNADLFNGITGLHFHTNCDSSNFAPLLATVQHIDKNLSRLLSKVHWINLGGGYLFNEADDFRKFYEAAGLLKQKYNVELFIEPGADVVREAGYLVSSVLDLFVSDGKTVAVLDTSVNHMPEVFEYQESPDVLDDVDDGQYEYILAGCTCLAGDVFGEYAFNEPLKIGSRVTFANVGAYTLVKAHMFNGVNLPSIYALTTDGKLELKRRFGYEDFLSRCGEADRVIG